LVYDQAIPVLLAEMKARDEQALGAARQIARLKDGPLKGRLAAYASSDGAQWTLTPTRAIKSDRCIRRQMAPSFTMALRWLANKIRGDCDDSVAARSARKTLKPGFRANPEKQSPFADRQHQRRVLPREALGGEAVGGAWHVRFRTQT
jgi:hypothetical protein